MSAYSVFVLSAIAFSLWPTSAIAQTPKPASTPTPTPAVQPTAPPSEVGLEFEGVSTFNVAPVTETTYTGDCPGVELDRNAFKARFRSSKTPPAERRRVTIRNITTGMAGNPSPYTDREYNRDRLSEATTTEFGTEHSGQRLRVMFGVNTFSYEIRESDIPLDSGTFTSTFNRTQQQVVRNARWVEARICANSAVATNVCADLRRQNQFRCPNGNVLKTDLLDGEVSGIRTSFANQSNRPVRFRIGSDLYRLEPGQRIRLRRSSTSTFSLSYNAACTNCELDQTTRILPGKRLQFVDRGKTAAGNRVELVDYPFSGENIEE
jgi:hypothetical protein